MTEIDLVRGRLAYEIRLWESKYLLQVRECQLIPKSSALFTCSHGSAINKHSRRYDWIIYIFSRDRGDRRPQITTVTRRINRVSVPSERDVCENEYVGETRRQNNWVFFLVRQHTDTNVGFHAIDQRHTIHFMRVRWYWFIWVRVPYNAVSWYRGKKKSIWIFYSVYWRWAGCARAMNKWTLIWRDVTVSRQVD